MFVRKILVPTDFSDASDAALNYADAIAGNCGAELVMMTVVEPLNPLTYAESFSPVPDVDGNLAQQSLQARIPGNKTVRYVTEVAWGAPAEEIVALAEREGVDLIVMSTHGRTGLAHLLMGSVAEAVVRTAPCPVLTLRKPVKQSMDQCEGQQPQTEQNRQSPATCHAASGGVP